MNEQSSLLIDIMSVIIMACSKKDAKLTLQALTLMSDALKNDTDPAFMQLRRISLFCATLVSVGSFALISKCISEIRDAFLVKFPELIGNINNQRELINKLGGKK